jgi:hypothetical protein
MTPAPKNAYAEFDVDELITNKETKTKIPELLHMVLQLSWLDTSA